MRLITWNCKGAFHRKHDFVAPLRPDILIVPECEKISGIAQSFNSAPVQSFEWFGTNPRKGLAAISYGDYALEVHPSYNPRFQWIVPLSVSAPVAFVLFAVWTLPFGRYGGRYVRPLLEAFEFYESTIETSEVIWAGDFNSNFIWDKPSRRYKFCDFVSLLSQRGFHSLYHHQRQCEHGKEPDYTFYHHHNPHKGYHIDYVFADEKLHPRGIEVFIGSHAEWLRLAFYGMAVACASTKKQDSTRWVTVRVFELEKGGFAVGGWETHVLAWRTRPIFGEYS